MEDKNKELLEKWHKVVFDKDMETLKSLLSDKIIFRFCINNTQCQS